MFDAVCAIINPTMVNMNSNMLKLPYWYASIPARHVDTKVITSDQGLVAINQVFNDIGGRMYLVEYMFPYTKGRNTKISSVQTI